MTVTVNKDAPLEDEKAWVACERIAADVSKEANQTSAPIGIAYATLGSGKKRVVRVGWRGAPAVALEFGTRHIPAKRYVKRALDQHRVS